MEPTQGNIARNTTWLTGAYVFQKVFAFIYFTLIARWLGADNIGTYTFVISLVTIFSVILDFGLSPVLIRESAKFKDKANTYLNNVLTVKLFLTVITLAIIIIVINLLDKGSLVLTMVYLTAVVMILDSFSLSFWAIFRARQNLKYEAISIAINQLFIFSVGLIGVWLKFPLYILIIALLCGSLFSFIYSFLLIRYKLRFKLRLRYHKETIKLLLKIALPFALAGIFTRVYSYIDQILLSVLISDTVLGWYSVAYKLTYAFQFVPAAFSAAIFPAMSSYYLCQKEKLQNIFETSMYLLIIAAIPIAFGVASLADKIILTLYESQYEPSVLALQIFIFAVIAIFLSYPIGAILNACDKQTINTINLGIVMIVNIILNIILIPLYQHVGASIAALVSLTLLVVLNMFWVPKIIRVNFKFLIIKFFKALICAFFMVVVIFIFKPMTNFIFLIAIGAITYILLMYLIKGFTKQDVKNIWQSMIRKQV